RMDVNGHAEPSALAGDDAKEIVLQRLVLRGARTASGGILGVDAPRASRIGIVEIERAQIRRLELLRYGARATLPLERGDHDQAHIRIKIARDRAHPKIAQI